MPPRLLCHSAAALAARASHRPSWASAPVRSPWMPSKIGFDASAAAKTRDDVAASRPAPATPLRTDRRVGFIFEKFISSLQLRRKGSAYRQLREHERPAAARQILRSAR